LLLKRKPLYGWPEIRVSVETLVANLEGLQKAAAHLVEQKQTLPALVLIYSGMDIVAGLERQVGEGTKAAFVRWCDNYLLKAQSLACSALELYGARCGILHTYSPDSDLSKAGKVRRVFYAWGTATTESLNVSAAHLKKVDVVGLHLDDLLAAFEAGIVKWFDDVIKDPERKAKVETGAGMWFVNLPVEVMDKYIGVISQKPAV
jgi:hypothetical protein